MSKAADLIGGVAQGARDVGRAARNAPLLFSVTACVVAICATIVVVYWMSTAKPITKPEVEDLIRVHFSASGMTKAEFSQALTERDRSLAPVADAALKAMASKLDAVAARIDQEHRVAGESRDSTRKAIDSISARIDRLYERMPAPRAGDGGATR